MPVFRFHARNARGEPQNGTLTAASLEVLTAELRGRGLLIVDIEPATAAETPARSRVSLNPFSWLPPASFAVEVGFQQLSAMLHSGLSLLASLRTVAEQARRPRATRVWENLCERIEEGATFSSALAAHPKVFTVHVIQLVKVGEHAGTLDTSLNRAAEHLERARNLRLVVLNALAYPAIVVLMAVGVTAFMVLNVIPKIQKFLGGNGRKLPAITQTLVEVSNAVMAYLPYLCIGFVAAVLAIFFCYRWPPGRRVMDGLLLRVPVVGGVLRLSGTAVFARGLSSLLESGVTLLDSLTTVEQLLANRVLALRIAAARQAVLRGETLASSLGGRREFLPMLGRMVTVGESAGTLAPVLTEVAKFHENQLVITIRRMSVLVEPVLILVVGGIVGFVYTAFFISIFAIATGGR